MFKIAASRTIAWPVVIPVPQDGGRVQKFEIQAEFLMLLKSSLDEVTSAARSDGDDGDLALLREVLVGWSRVCDEAGNPIEFNAEARDALIDIPYVRLALLKSYFEASSGSAASRKN